MSTVYTCSKGFLIEKTDNGKYTPFFVKVREQDIINDEGGQVFQKEFISDGWLVESVHDGYVTATRSIEIAQPMFQLNADDPKELYCSVNLPIRVKSDNFLGVSLNLWSYHEMISTSIPSFTPIYDDQVVIGIRISLRRSNLADYPDYWWAEPSINKSKIMIIASGK